MADDAKAKKDAKEGVKKDDKDLSPEELIKKAFEDAAKPAGPLDRAVELYGIMAFSATAIFIINDSSDYALISALLAMFVPLSFLGGVLSNTKPKLDEKDLDAIAGGKEEKKA